MLGKLKYRKTQSLLEKLLAEINTDNKNNLITPARQNKLMSLLMSMGYLNYDICIEISHQQNKKRFQAIDAKEHISQSLKDTGISAVVIKGLSFEKAIYGNEKLRDIGDTDILIKPLDALGAHRALCELGYTQQLGPSSGSSSSLGRASFAAMVAQQNRKTSREPIRRYPNKDAFCPYVKAGYPTVELHDGFQGLPSWYTKAAVERASANGLTLMRDNLDVLIFLLINTYENAESFYSNCFDDKVILRDFVDLAVYLGTTKDKINRNIANSLIAQLGIEQKVGHVLFDLEELFPGAFEDVLPNISRVESLWNADIKKRATDSDLCKRNTTNVFRNNLSAVAARSKVDLLGSLKADQEISCSGHHHLKSPGLALQESDNGITLRVNGVVDQHDGSTLVQISFFPVYGGEPPLFRKVSVLLASDTPTAFYMESSRLPEAAAIYKRSGTELLARYDENGDILVFIPENIAEVVFCENETVLVAGIYDKHYGDVFWVRVEGKTCL